MCPSGVVEKNPWWAAGISSPSEGTGSAGRVAGLAFGAVARRFDVIVRERDEEWLPELFEGRLADAGEVPERMRLDRLDADGTHVRIVGVPPPESIGDPDHVLELTRPPALEELVERDPVRAVGLLGQQLQSHRACELPRGGPVIRTDDVIGRERAVEREERPGAAGDGVIVVAEPVGDRPRRRGPRLRRRRRR